MVIGQLSLLLLGTAAACFWHIRKLRATNRSLFEALESQQNGPSAENARADPAAEEPAATSSGAEASAAEQAPGPEAELDSRAADEELPAEATEAPEETQPPSPPSVRTGAGSEEAAAAMPNAGGDGLKKLLQQFTQDSRDMVTRIEQLERRTQALIDQAQDDASEESPEEAQTAGTAEAQEPETEDANESANEEVNEQANAQASG